MQLQRASTYPGHLSLHVFLMSITDTPSVMMTIQCSCSLKQIILYYYVYQGYIAILLTLDQKSKSQSRATECQLISNFVNGKRMIWRLLYGHLRTAMIVWRLKSGQN